MRKIGRIRGGDTRSKTDPQFLFYLAKASLRHAAEGLLNALGFSVADLQLVANDAALLCEWARMHLDVRMSLAIDFSLAKLLAAAWPHLSDSSVTPVFPFFDSRVDVTMPEVSNVKKTGSLRQRMSSPSLSASNSQQKYENSAQTIIFTRNLSHHICKYVLLKKKQVDQWC